MFAMLGARAFSLAAERASGAVSCGVTGVFVGDVPLLQLIGTGPTGQWVVRALPELNEELSAQYGLPIDVAAKANALALIAAAVNRGDLAMAAIATVQMQFPDPPLLTKRLAAADEIARRALELHRSRLLKVWEPDEHPRTGMPPNPGWFAPADGGTNDSSPTRTAANVNPAERSDALPTDSDNWVGLPPDDYIGELRDLLVWLANATPEEEAAIRAEIKRRYYDVGDVSGGNALNRALSDILDPDFDPNLHPEIDKKRRQTILNDIAVYATADPTQMGQIQNLLPLTILAAPNTRSPAPEISPAPAARAPKPEISPAPGRGGRLGGVETRAQNAEIAAQLENEGFTITYGGGTDQKNISADPVLAPRAAPTLILLLKTIKQVQSFASKLSIRLPTERRSRTNLLRPLAFDRSFRTIDSFSSRKDTRNDPKPTCVLRHSEGPCSRPIRARKPEGRRLYVDGAVRNEQTSDLSIVCENPELWIGKRS